MTTPFVSKLIIPPVITTRVCFYAIAKNSKVKNLHVDGTANATNVGSGCAITDEYDDYDYQSVDITENDGAVPALRDDTDNTTAIGLMRTLPNSIAEQKATYPVAIYGRTLYKDGNWNSICLPFSLDDFDGTIFEDATVMTLGNSEACKTNFDATSGTLNLEFLPDNKIEAGVAYIVKWDKADDYKGNESTYDITDPVFCGVTIENENPNNHGIVSKDNKVTFVGNYNLVSIADEDKSLLFLGANNTLYYPNAAMTIGAFHAYFQLDGITAGDPDACIKAFNLNFGNGDNATGIITFTSATEDDGSWYTLSGVKLNAKPTQRGIYLNNGHKVMIK